MQRLEWKVRIAFLWIIMAISTSAESILYIAHPGNINDAIAGKIEGQQVTTGFLAMLAAFWVIPFVLAFLTFVLKDTVNRGMNMVMGLLLAGLWATDLLGPLFTGDGLEVANAAVMVVTVAAGVLIFWHALRWPQQRPTTRELPAGLTTEDLQKQPTSQKVEHREFAHRT